MIVWTLFTRKYIFNRNPVIGYALAKTLLIYVINYGKGNTLFWKYPSKNSQIWMLNTVLANIERDCKRTVRTMGVASLYNIPCYNICCIYYEIIYKYQYDIRVQSWVFESHHFIFGSNHKRYQLVYAVRTHLKSTFW